MKRLWISIFIIILYCIPFVFFAMYKDFTKRSMVGYLIMVLATILLAFIGQYFCNSIPLIIGNVMTVLVSSYLNNKMGVTEGWNGSYFKPFSQSQLLIVVSGLNLIPQLIAVFIAINMKMKRITKNVSG